MTTLSPLLRFSLRALCLSVPLAAAFLPGYAGAEVPAAAPARAPLPAPEATAAPALTPASSTVPEAAPTNSTVAAPTDCLYYPLVSKTEFPTSVEMVEAWTTVYNYLDGDEYRAHRKKLGEIWGEEPMFILTNVEIGAAQFRPVVDRARKAGFPEPLVEQISLCMAIRAGNVDGLKDWLPRVQSRADNSKTYPGDEALLPTVEGAQALAKFGVIALQLETDRRTFLMQVMEKPRMLAEADSVFRDLDAIDSACIRLQNKGTFKPGDTVPPAEWEEALPKEPRFQRLRRTGMNVLGHAYGNQKIGERPMVPRETFQYFESMFKAGDWFPYRDPATVTSPGTAVLDSSQIPKSLNTDGSHTKVDVDDTWTPVPKETSGTPGAAPKVVPGTRVTPAAEAGAGTGTPDPVVNPAKADSKAPHKSSIPPPAIRELPPEKD